MNISTSWDNADFTASDAKGPPSIVMDSLSIVLSVVTSSTISSLLPLTEIKLSFSAILTLNVSFSSSPIPTPAEYIFAKSEILILSVLVSPSSLTMFQLNSKYFSPSCSTTSTLSSTLSLMKIDASIDPSSSLTFSVISSPSSLTLVTSHKQVQCLMIKCHQRHLILYHWNQHF